MRFKKFDQSDYLGKDDRGICIHLVIMWLSGGGKELSHMFGGRVRQAQKVYASGAKINDALLGQYMMTLGDADIFNLTGDIDSAVAFLSKPGRYVVGFTSESDAGGHAIGFIRGGPASSAGFDPNEKYEWYDSDDEYAFNVRFALVNYYALNDYDQAFVYRCESDAARGVAGLQKQLAAEARPARPSTPAPTRRTVAFRPRR